MRAFNVLLSIVVSAAIFLGLFEGGLRLLGQGPPEELVQFDPKLGWSKKPGVEVSRSGGEYRVTIRTNQHGLVDDPMPSTEKPNGTFRVLALGDSFTQGFSVAREDLFVDLLEQWWRDEGRAVEVVNAGTEAYDTAQAVAWLEEHGAEFEPDLVLLFPYQNDLYWNAQAEYFSVEGARGKPRYAPDGTLEPRELEPPEEESWCANLAICRVGARLFASAPEGGDRHLFTPPDGSGPVLKELGVLLEESPEFLAEVRARTKGALLGLERACASLGATPVVVPIPDKAPFDESRAEQLDRLLGERRWSADRPVDLVLALASEAGIATLDPRAYLKGRADAGETLYFERDWHFDPTGNAAFATFLHDRLDELELGLPAATTAAPLPERVELARAGLPFALKLFLALWVVLTLLYWGTYRDEARWLPPIRIAALLGAVFAIVYAVFFLQAVLPPAVAGLLFPLLVAAILGFVVWKLGRRVGTIAELLRCFALRGHWYLMPLVVVLLTIGSLLVVAASSPLVAPFIYTLF